MTARTSRPRLHPLAAVFQAVMDQLDADLHPEDERGHFAKRNKRDDEANGPDLRGGGGA